MNTAARMDDRFRYRHCSGVSCLVDLSVDAFLGSLHQNQRQQPSSLQYLPRALADKVYSSACLRWDNRQHVGTLLDLWKVYLGLPGLATLSTPVHVRSEDRVPVLGQLLAHFARRCGQGHLAGSPSEVALKLGMYLNVPGAASSAEDEANQEFRMLRSLVAASAAKLHTFELPVVCDRQVMHIYIFIDSVQLAGMVLYGPSL